AQPLRQRVVVIFGDRKDGLVGQEVDLGAALLAGSGLVQHIKGNAARVLLFIGVAAAPDLDFKLLTQAVHAGDADPVQTAGDFVGRSVEFTAGVQFGKNHLA